MKNIHSICVYCGSSAGIRPQYLDAARSFGSLIAKMGIDLVYGGGRAGMMGALADSALAAGASVTGVIPAALMQRELGHGGITSLHVVANMHERKKMMADLAQAFVALPGGWGTLEEFTETLTWLQLGLHQKPIGLLNVAGYFDPLLRLSEMMANEGFVRPSAAPLFYEDTEPQRLLDALDQACRR